jgi:hypothetical protein
MQACRKEENANEIRDAKHRIERDDPEKASYVENLVIIARIPVPE